MTTPSFDDTDVAPTNDVAATRPYDELNVSSDAFWEQDIEERDLIFKQLREQRPITWQRPIETALHPDPNDRGFWAVVRHADIVEVSKNADVFVSRYGVMFDVLPPVFLQMAMSFLAMDNPQHDKVRGLVGKAFTRPQIRRIDEDIASRARRIVATAREKATAGEPIDFVSDISRHLPIEMFGDMFGVPEELRPTVAHLADEIVAWADPVLLAGRDGAQVQVEATAQIHQIAQQLIAERREHPADDLLTNLVQAEVDGEKLTDPEIRRYGAFRCRSHRHHPPHGQLRGQGAHRFPRSAPVVVGGLRGPHQLGDRRVPAVGIGGAELPAHRGRRVRAQRATHPAG
jgi:cytochrome P450